MGRERSERHTQRADRSDERRGALVVMRKQRRSLRPQSNGRQAITPRRSPPPHTAEREAPAGPHRLRIIGGAWRGRRLTFPAHAGIRPTPDRVRETLFNWLAPRIRGARVLDLFAGSGALGLEALSRGAAEVQFVDLDGTAVRALRARIEEWRAADPAAVIGHGEVSQADAPAWLAHHRAVPYDLAFVDPPFASDARERAIAQLARAQVLAPDARVYVEAAASQALPPLPSGWSVVRSGRAGDVGYHLLASGGSE
jgi:16S rRNA (guanine966-N2)-methyltransferase